MRIVISESNGKSHQVELAKDKESVLSGKKVGDELDGNLVGAAGYMLKLTGGSDGSGFPMREEVHGSAKKVILTSDGVGFHATHNGERRRKYVRGNTYSSEIVQVNASVKTAGPSPLDQLFPKAEKKEKK
jgi:small subunit ribosomal protein S6e